MCKLHLILEIVVNFNIISWGSSSISDIEKYCSMNDIFDLFNDKVKIRTLNRMRK